MVSRVERRMRRLDLLLLLAALGSLGCGDNAGDGRGGSASTGGTDGAGGTASGGDTSSGGEDGSGGEEGSGGEACESGYTAGAATLYPFPFDNCGAIEGLEDLEDASFRDLTLSEPVAPGETYAFSAEMESSAGSWEVYGATEKCGEAGELLDRIEVPADGVVCHEVTPTEETYSHLIWVWYVAAQQGDTTFCAGGTCPGR